MSGIWARIGGALGYVFKPELKDRRVLHQGITRGNLPLLAIFTILVLLLSVGLTGQTFSLYLPHYFDWKWVDVTVISLPPWTWLLMWLIGAGLCLAFSNQLARVASIRISPF